AVSMSDVSARTKPRQRGASLRSGPHRSGAFRKTRGIIPTEWLAGWVGDRMKRREFITLLGGAAAAWPLAARAQQTPRPPAIGFLNPTTTSVANQQLAAFVERLRAIGWIEGRAVAIKVRWGEGRSERAAAIVAKFVRQKVDIIVSKGSASVLAAREATSVIPIVFAGGDPVGTGLVVTLARPGGDVTGVSLQQADLAGKRLERLRELVPALRRLAILGNAGNPVTLRDLRAVEAAAGAPGLTVVTVEIWRVEGMAAGFAALEARRDMFRPIRSQARTT